MASRKYGTPIQHGLGIEESAKGLAMHMFIPGGLMSEVKVRLKVHSHYLIGGWLACRLVASSESDVTILLSYDERGYSYLMTMPSST